MLPYLLILPIQLFLTVALPVVQTTHALQTKSSDRKVWLCYWILFCAAAWVLYYFEWVLRLPFYMLSLFFVDLYYEMQLLVVAYLVLPQPFGLRSVMLYVEPKSHIIFDKLRGVAQDAAKPIYKKYLELKESLF
mmetsp:Transcript_5184/g.12470  ORF Transcript_5184/g.12470 Transcript_5184/m.12470 type:complete len:134 (+) Transcript_5184:75-476(+)|eukprot:5557542-Amphidinium_carterae.1